MSAAGLADLFSLYSAFPLLASASFIADSPASSGSSTSLSLTTDSLSTEPALLLKAFSSIFSDNESSWEAAQTISRNAREEVGLPNTTSLGYGEILPESVFTIMCEIKDVFGLERGGVVYDLGSGSGRVLFAACLAHDFRLSKGIEFIESLHNAALRNKSRWEEHNVVTPEEGGPVDRVEFDFLKGDITKITSRALSPAPTVLFCHATLFDDDLFDCVQVISENCNPGTFFVMITKPLCTGVVTGIETLSYKQYRMSWGHTTVYLQRRMKPNE